MQGLLELFYLSCAMPVLVWLGVEAVTGQKHKMRGDFLTVRVIGICASVFCLLLLINHATDRFRREIASSHTTRADRNLAKLVLLLATLVGAGVLGGAITHSVKNERSSEADAAVRFDAIRTRFSNQEPLLKVDQDGFVIRAKHPPPATTMPRARRLQVLGHNADEERLVSAPVPLLVVRMSGVFLKFAVRGTGFDPRTLPLDAHELKHLGPLLLLHERRSNGDRLLVWTE